MERTTATVVLFLSTLSAILICILTILYYDNLVRMSELGYQKTTIVGSDCTYWQKCD